MVLEIQVPEVADILVKVAANKFGIIITPLPDDVRFELAAGSLFLVYCTR